jgi:hypothetical protein
MTIARRQIGARTEPAHVSAPPRLRQSQIAKPFPHVPDEQPGFLARVGKIWGRG